MACPCSWQNPRQFMATQAKEKERIQATTGRDANVNRYTIIFLFFPFMHCK